jgi:hypothetical protein
MAAVIATAFAQSTAPEGPPRLKFVTIPFEGSTTNEHKVMPYRFYDKVVVTVWDPIACGQKPLDPNFSIQGDKLLLSYSLSPAAAKAKPCTLVSEFTVTGVPHRDFEVGFAGGTEPYVIATMRKCPFYKPTSNDIWECLAPATQ